MSGIPANLSPKQPQSHPLRTFVKYAVVPVSIAAASGINYALSGRPTVADPTKTCSQAADTFLTGDNKNNANVQSFMNECTAGVTAKQEKTSDMPGYKKLDFLFKPSKSLAKVLGDKVKDGLISVGTGYSNGTPGWFSRLIPGGAFFNSIPVKKGSVDFNTDPTTSAACPEGTTLVTADPNKGKCIDSKTPPTFVDQTPAVCPEGTTLVTADLNQGKCAKVTFNN